MAILVLKTDDFQHQVNDVARQIVQYFEVMRHDADEEMSPDQLYQQLQHFFVMLSAAEVVSHASAELAQEHIGQVTEMGDVGLQLLSGFSYWAGLMEQDHLRDQIDRHTVALAVMLARMGGHLEAVDIVTDALARVANILEESADLEVLSTYVSEVLTAVAPAIQVDKDKRDANRPWRILILNHGIIATRSHNPDLMCKAFDDLERLLPDDAGDFFREGMEQMARLPYPSHVRRVVQDYYQRSSVRKLH